MASYKLVIFDVDGTLLDTTEGVLDSVKYTIDKFSLPMLSKEQLLTFIGPPIQNSFGKYYSLTPKELQDLANVFRKRYKEHDLYKAVPYDGIYDVFDVLKRNNISIAIATYKREDYAMEILKHFKFDLYTSILYGADNDNKLTKKDIIVKCIKAAAIEKNDYHKVVMIGDSDNDSIGANEIGIDFIGVTYGFGFKTEREVLENKAVGAVKTPLDLILRLQYD